ncbi:dickkopf-related protein 4-like [Brienomyrus brachyistius]|uniref:dickkopf-related protein 4-like n=1 Tax=Brienomyrus brachyistius TaxID=42636 RepID=UPI0020B382E2|nr:dickkopf-related protein 4-like [Brienomyrus brachyistius]
MRSEQAQSIKDRQIAGLGDPQVAFSRSGYETCLLNGVQQSAEAWRGRCSLSAAHSNTVRYLDGVILSNELGEVLQESSPPRNLHQCSRASGNNIIRPSTSLGPVNQTNCKADRDCGNQEYCEQASQKAPVCAACRVERRRCQRIGVCCQGLQCINGQCKKSRKEEPNNPNRRKSRPKHKRKEKKKGQEMAKCVRSEDCGEGLCCRRYLKGNKCQRIGTEGEACSLHSHSKRPRAVEYCHCAQGLSCHAQDQSTKGNGICRPTSPFS